MFKYICGSLLAIALVATINLSAHSLRAGGAWYVGSHGNDANDCAAPATPCQTLGAVVDRLNPGDIVYVAAGIYMARYVTETAVLDLKKDVVFLGGWDTMFQRTGDLSIIDGQRVRSNVRILNGANVIFDHFVFQNGNSFSAGGISMWQSSLTLNHSAVRNNVGYAGGGGIYADDSALTLNNSSLTGNRVNFGDGGGIRHAFEISR